MKKGTYVLRSTYQKLFEQNKKLVNDIRILSEEGMPSLEKITTLKKWRRKFDNDKILGKALMEYAQEYFKNNPIVK